MIKDSERIEELKEEINNLKGEILFLENENYFLDRKNSHLTDIKVFFENSIKEMFFNYPELIQGYPFQKLKIVPTDNPESFITLQSIRDLYEIK